MRRSAHVFLQRAADLLAHAGGALHEAVALQNAHGGQPGGAGNGIVAEGAPVHEAAAVFGDIAAREDHAAPDESRLTLPEPVNTFIFVNGKQAGFDVVLRDGDRVGLAPVTGGM